MLYKRPIRVWDLQLYTYALHSVQQILLKCHNIISDVLYGFSGRYDKSFVAFISKPMNIHLSTFQMKYVVVSFPMKWFPRFCNFVPISVDWPRSYVCTHSIARLSMRDAYESINSKSSSHKQCQNKAFGDTLSLIVELKRPYSKPGDYYVNGTKSQCNTLSLDVSTDAFIFHWIYSVLSS